MAADPFEELAKATLGNNKRFLPSSVIDTARALSRLPYTPPDTALPERFRDLDYDRYIRIQTRPEAALFRGEPSDFVIEPLHRGFVFSSTVRLFTVRDGVIERVSYDPSLFRYGDIGAPEEKADIGFSGFRILARNGDGFVEEAVFQGATYFRAIARGQTLGAMARGLSLRTSDPGGEEIPAFRMIFIERPMPGEPLTIHAIADSESLTAAFRFVFRPGGIALVDTDMSVFARQDIANFGIGGMQTTYFFGANDRQGVDDLRVAAFENDGLQMHRGNGEWLWRPINNPADLQISAFVDTSPRGFGFLQRQRAASAFEDDNQGFESRPSVFVEPVGDWGAGSVELIEIPTQSDINDNVIAYWRPAKTLAAGESMRFAYRQSWCWEPLSVSGGAKVIQSRSGAGIGTANRRFLVEFAGETLKGIPASEIGIELSAVPGKIVSHLLRHDPVTGIGRLIFQVESDGSAVTELRAVLLPKSRPPSETWLFRWTA
jgi:periplasmic glucans biosynthesis protein